MDDSAIPKVAVNDAFDPDVTDIACSHRSTSKFMEFAAEIRIKIYEHLLITPELIWLRLSSSPTESQSKTVLRAPERYISAGIVRVSKLFHNETSPILYGSNGFVLQLEFKTNDTKTYEEKLVSLLSMLGSRNCSYLRSVRLFIDEIGQSLWREHAQTISEAFKNVRQLTIRLVTHLCQCPMEGATDGFRSVCATACNFALKHSNQMRTLTLIADVMFPDHLEFDHDSLSYIDYDGLDPAWTTSECECWTKGSRSLLERLDLPELQDLYIVMQLYAEDAREICSIYLRDPSQSYDWNFRLQSKSMTEADEGGFYEEQNTFVWKQVPKMVLDDDAKRELHLCRTETME